MRKIAFFLTLMLMLTTCCTRMSQHERILADIDSLTETDADSARRMLMNMKDVMKDAQPDTKAYYDLLRVKADDKAHQQHTSDSLITSVVNYLEKRDKHDHLPEAYYYVGRVNTDLQNGEKAILFFHKALLADSLNEHTRLKSRCYAQIGYIYLRNGLVVGRELMKSATSFSTDSATCPCIWYSNGVDFPSPSINRWFRVG